jgi:hypothetical protein
MSNTIKFVEALDINEAAAAIFHTGVDNTIILEGEPGTGKTSVLRLLAEMNGDKWRKVGQLFPTDTYNYVYIDATGFDTSDASVRVPDIAEKKLVQCMTDLIPQNGKPCICMVDEIGKPASKMAGNALNRFVLERCMGDMPLVEGSIVFATTNNGSDMLGDQLKSHAVNRVVKVPFRKPTNKRWVEDFAVKNGIDPLIIAWALRTERAFMSYLDEGQAENPFIFNPSRPGVPFVSPRSLERASNIVKKRKFLSQKVINTNLAGAVGENAAHDMAALFAMNDEVMLTETIVANPRGVPLPTKPAATFMMLYRALDDLKTQDDLTAFMIFLERIGSDEVLGSFRTACFKHPKMIKLAKGNKSLVDWAMKNNAMLIG